MKKISLTETDRFIYENEIAPFLPNRIFDVHTHLFGTEYHPNYEEESILREFGDIRLADMQLWWRTLFPGIDVNGLLMGYPAKGCDIEGENEFVARQVKNTENKFLLMTSPELPVKKLEEQILRLKPAGLKPYFIFSSKPEPNSSRITDFITEEQIALADRYGLSITLHVAKSRGMADEENLMDIARLVADYPNCNFILAHCGRCFIPPNMEDALKKLPVAENLWLDTSAVCDIGVFLYLFDKYDCKKILFGTDSISSTGFRGNYIRLGMGWHCGFVETFQTRNEAKITTSTFAVYENLCAMLHAARFCKLSEADLEDIFYNNASRLFL